MRRIVAISAALTVLALSGCAVGAPTTVTIEGTVSVPSGLEHRLDGGEGCAPTGGYEDVDQGAQIKVTDASGAIVGTGTLGPGEKTGEIRPWNGRSAFPCTFAFTVENAADSEFYEITLGDRGSVTYSRDELDDVTLVLGDI